LITRASLRKNAANQLLTLELRQTSQLPEKLFESGSDPRSFRGYGIMWHWLSSYGGVLAIVVTAGVAVLLVCCLSCSNCGSREKDDLFHRHEV
jgi:hypothetical protein